LHLLFQLHVHTSKTLSWLDLCTLAKHLPHTLHNLLSSIPIKHQQCQKFTCLVIHIFHKLCASCHYFQFKKEDLLITLPWGLRVRTIVYFRLIFSRLVKIRAGMMLPSKLIMPSTTKETANLIAKNNTSINTFKCWNFVTHTVDFQKNCLV
jgi:hypothetical protein